MTWQSSTDLKDKIFAALVYSLPLIDVFSYGQFLFTQFPQLIYLYLPLQPIVLIYQSIPFAGLIVFFVLLLAVVRNMKISRFIRFNTMQAILLDILLILFGLVLSILVNGLGANNILVETLYNVIFLGIWAGCIYAMVQSLRGQYADIPTISEAANSQTP
jgi:uncharacterized membrane protein